MDGFKDSTKMKYMMGGDVSAYKTGGTVKKAMGGACAPVKKMRGGMMDENVSSRPTTASGRRMTNEELGMTPGGVDPSKKKPKGMGAMSDLDKARAKKKAMPKVMSDLERARIMPARPMPMKKGGVPAHSDRPMIRRKTGGLTAMPKGKC